MPNHISNTIEMCDGKPFPAEWGIDPEAEDVIDFNRIIPQPENIIRNGALSQDDMKLPNWYDWNISQWGTKWNAYQIHFDKDTDYQIDFDTAWSPPDPVIRKMAEITDRKFTHQWQDEGDTILHIDTYNSVPFHD